MSFIDRASKILTPPFGRKRVSETLPAPTVSPDSRISLITQTLKELLLDRALDKETVHEHLTVLKNIGTEYGSFVTAAEIRDCTQRLSKSKEQGTRYKLGRGYELAANLYLQYLMDCIRDIEEKGISPSIRDFEQSITELIWCLFQANRYSRAIETCLEFEEELLRRTCFQTTHRSVYFHLADKTASCILQSSFEEMERIESKHNLAERSTRQFDTPPPDEPRLSRVFSSSLITHLSELKQQIEQIHGERSKLVPAPVIPHAEARKVHPRNQVQLQLNSLHLFANTSHVVTRSGLHAFVIEQIGLLQESLNGGSGHTHLAEAAHLYEKQGEQEEDLELHMLALKRFKKAEKIWKSLGSDQNVQRLQNKRRNITN